MDLAVREIQAKVADKSAFVGAIAEQVAKVIVGQKYMVERLLIALLADGHVLLEGVPGLAKTLTVRTLARAVSAEFRRIQFTPDLLPADLTGTMVFDQKEQRFTPHKGPIFSNLVLADEINRAPAKVQSALLEAMQERQVTIGSETYRLGELFMVLATQNPIEQEGTYPLPEAQVDRFMLKLKVTYPRKNEERQVIERMTQAAADPVETVVTPREILDARSVVGEIYVDEKIKDYVLDLVFCTRKPEDYGLDELKPLIEWGASPRASIYLVLAARAHAFLERRGYVTPEDVKAIGLDVLRHRVILTYEAEAEDLTSDDVISRVFDHVEVP